MNGQPDRPEAEDADDDVSAAEDPATEEGAADSGPDSVQAELQAKVDENWEKYLRAAAELENVRKRAGRDVENAHKFALERFATELLAVRDSLEMGLAAGEDADADTLLQGKEATSAESESAIKKPGDGATAERSSSGWPITSKPAPGPRGPRTESPGIPSPARPA